MQAEILFIGWREQEQEQYPSAVFAFDSAATQLLSVILQHETDSRVA
jgi:hypothetical protein